VTTGHRQGQQLWDELGSSLGYEPIRSMAGPHPTDGVWMPKGPTPRFAVVPIAAVEIAVSESRKTLRGSIVTLECVSPALAVIVIHEAEIRRRALRRGAPVSGADRQVALLTEQANSLACCSRQRIEVWTFARLLRRLAARQAAGDTPITVTVAA
jgi:hypothetical protein